MNTIYDFGANKGLNLAYYLKKADRVVAVEANPSLCEQISKLFSKEIGQGRLFIENCVLTRSVATGTVPFFIHRTNDVLSQLEKPQPDRLHDFDEVQLPCNNVQAIVAKYGPPLYIKIDIEGYDHEILGALFEQKIVPSYISAESHSVKTFASLVSEGKYCAFKLVDGPSVSDLYENAQINVNGKVEVFSFEYDSSGPFGEDIPGEWMCDDEMFYTLAFEGLGWKDIHATTMFSPRPFRRTRLRHIILTAVLKVWTVVLERLRLR